MAAAIWSQPRRRILDMPTGFLFRFFSNHGMLQVDDRPEWRVLADPSPSELEILGALPYQENDAVLHTDTRLLPRRKAAWAAWNYQVSASPEEPPTLTYDMNILQASPPPKPFSSP